MPRRARSFQKSICYHVMNRGVNRGDIFVVADDRKYFAELVARYKQRYEVKVFHWVLMGNHYHLLIEAAFDHLRPFVGGIQQAYAQYHHRAHCSSGIFWQGRFMSKPVEIGTYLAACGRYIERNPVRAGLAELAWDYPWSSAKYYVNKSPDLVTDQNPYLGTFTKRDRRQYADALTAGTDDETIRAYHTEKIVGSSDFRKTLKKERGHHRLKKGRVTRSV